MTHEETLEYQKQFKDKCTLKNCKECEFLTTERASVSCNFNSSDIQDCQIAVVQLEFDF